MHERKIRLEFPARRIGLSENRSSVCKPVNIVVARPRVASDEEEGSTEEVSKRNRGAREERTRGAERARFFSDWLSSAVVWRR